MKTACASSTARAANWSIERRLAEAMQVRQSGRRRARRFREGAAPARIPLFPLEIVLATPHIGGSTEEAQEIVGVRIAEQVVEYLQNGVAINAVNMPSLSPEQYRTLGPYADLAERLGEFRRHIATGNPQTVRLHYFGRIGENNTQLLRNAGLAGVLSRSLEHKANVVNAMQIANERGFTVEERREPRQASMDSIRLELVTSEGTFTVEGAVVLGRPRLLQVEGIPCEATLHGNLMYSKNEDVPGVIGYLGTVFGKNDINIANFALGRQEKAGTASRLWPSPSSKPISRSRTTSSSSFSKTKP